MAYKLEDGTGSRNKAAVFGNTLRTFDIEDSLVHFTSVKSGNITHEDILNGEVIGVFTSRTTASVVSSAGNNAIILIQNNDSINLLVIDRIYITVLTSGVTLPDFNATISIFSPPTFSGGTKLNAVNENLSSKIIPNVTLLSLPTITGPSPVSLFLTKGDTIELIQPFLDAFVLNFQNIEVINLRNNTGATIVLEAFIRFLMVNPGDSG